MKTLQLHLLLYLLAALAPFVSQAQKYTITSPKAGDHFHYGDSVLITWTSPNPSDTVRLEYSDDNGNSWFCIAQMVSGGTYWWHYRPKSSDSSIWFYDWRDIKNHMYQVRAIHFDTAAANRIQSPTLVGLGAINRQCTPNVALDWYAQKDQNCFLLNKQGSQAIVGSRHTVSIIDLQTDTIIRSFPLTQSNVPLGACHKLYGFVNDSLLLTAEEKYEDLGTLKVPNVLATYLLNVKSGVLIPVLEQETHNAYKMCVNPSRSKVFMSTVNDSAQIYSAIVLDFKSKEVQHYTGSFCAMDYRWSTDSILTSLYSSSHDSASAMYTLNANSGTIDSAIVQVDVPWYRNMNPERTYWSRHDSLSSTVLSIGDTSYKYIVYDSLLRPFDGLWSPDSRFIAIIDTLHDFTEVRVIEPETKSTIRIVEVQTEFGRVPTIYWDLSSQAIIIESSTKLRLIVRIRDSVVFRSAMVEQRYRDVAWSPEGTEIAAVSDSTIQVWRADGHTLLHHIYFPFANTFYTASHNELLKWKSNHEIFVSNGSKVYTLNINLNKFIDSINIPATFIDYDSLDHIVLLGTARKVQLFNIDNHSLCNVDAAFESEQPIILAYGNRTRFVYEGPDTTQIMTTSSCAHSFINLNIGYWTSPINDSFFVSTYRFTGTLLDPLDSIDPGFAYYNCSYLGISSFNSLRDTRLFGEEPYSIISQAAPIVCNAVGAICHPCVNRSQSQDEYKYYQVYSTPVFSSTDLVRESVIASTGVRLPPFLGQKTGIPYI